MSRRKAGWTQQFNFSPAGIHPADNPTGVHMSAVLEIRRLSHRFTGPDGQKSRPILNDISLTLNPGDSLGIIGPSGSGKSTLLNIAGTLLKPDSGEVILNSVNLFQQPESELAAIRNRQIGFVFQMHHLLPQCTALENILLPALAGSRGKVPKSITEYAFDLAEKTGIKNRLHDLPGRLSGGELLRVAIARALIHQPSLLLADEPTGALDGPTADIIGDLLLKMNQENGVTLLAVTHSESLARRLNKISRLENGSLIPVPDRFADK